MDLNLDGYAVGLPDAGDCWDRTIADHLRKDLNMVPTYHEIALYFLQDDTALQGLVGVYVDDSLICGNKNFMDITEKTLQKFESRACELDATTFAGVNVSTNGPKIILDQHQYVSQIKPLPKDASFSDYRSLRALPGAPILALTSAAPSQWQHKSPKIPFPPTLLKILT